MLKLLFANKTSNTYIQFFRYAIVGAIALSFDFSIMILLKERIHINYLVSAAAGFLVGVLVNYFLSVRWVFSNHKLKSKKMEFIIFAFIGIVGLGLTEFFLWFLTGVMGLYYVHSKIVTTGLVYLWNFFARKYTLFNSGGRNG